MPYGDRTPGRDHHGKGSGGNGSPPPGLAVKLPFILRHSPQLDNKFLLV